MKRNVISFLKAFFKIDNFDIVIDHSKKKIVFDVNSQEYFYDNLASGLQQIIKFLFSFELQKANYFEMAGNFTIENVIFEEPETNLHPTFQKLLPQLFQELSKELNVQFLISTHSPFIISAAAEFGETQKVYLIEKGQTVDLERKNTQRSSLGYSGGEAIIASNQILGAGLEDIFGKNLIFCEKSFSEFLNSFVKTHNLKTNLTFITAGGDNAILDQADIMGQILKNFTLYSESKIKFGMQTWAIFDTNSQLSSQQNQKKIQKIKDSGCKIIPLKKEELELFYPIEPVNEFLTSKTLPNWDKNEFLTFQKYLKQNQTIKTNFPNIKNNLAEFIGSKVDKNFVKTISNELYNILFS